MLLALRRWLCVAWLLALAGGHASGAAADVFPTRAWPPDDPALIALGRLLFYDPALSVNSRLACAGCHVQALAFTDGLRVARGATGQLLSRNTPSIANAAYLSSLGWSDPLQWKLEAQHRIPLFGHAPVEMGLREPLPRALRERLRSEPRYVRAWAAVRAARDVLPQALGQAPQRVTADTLLLPIAAFVRSLVSNGSAFDAWLYRDDKQPLSPEAQAGFALFNSPRLACAECHRGFLLGGTVRTLNRQQVPEFFNTGAGGRPELASRTDLAGRAGAQRAHPDQGLAGHTGRAADVGKFRTPSLRNVALTAPYMHDGSLPNLDAVLDHYARGGHDPALGRVGANPNLAAQMRGFALTRDERAQLLAFLNALTDERFVTTPEFADPWIETGPDVVPASRDAASATR